MYNETYLRVMPRDPYHLFTFWEISPDKFERAKKTVPDFSETTTRQLLRLYEVTAQGAGRRHDRPLDDIAVEEGKYSRYIRVPQPGCSYRIDYGLAASSGAFVPLCHSREVAMPAARVHEAISEKWVRADTGKLSDFSVRSGTIRADMPLADVATALPAAAVDALQDGGAARNDDRALSRRTVPMAAGASAAPAIAPCSSRIVPYPKADGAS